MALLKFKRSAVPAKVPSIADLALGELAINTYDGKVYTKKDDGTPAIVQVGGGGGVQTITSSDGSVTVTGTTDINLSVPVTAATQTVILPVRNNSGATLAKGTAVYINGALGQNPTVTKAIATGDATSAQTLGLVTANIANNAVGNVTLIGSLTNLDTSAYTDGAQLYLSPTTAGALTATKPYAPNHLVYMAVVEHAHPTLGKLFVKVQNGYEMDELHNVAAVSPANNDGLFYNTSTSLWEKKSIATTLGYTPANKAGDAFTGTITTTGLLGVGTASPTAIGGYGTITVDGATGSFTDYRQNGTNRLRIGGDNGAGFINAPSGTLRLLTNDADRLTINASGNVTASVDIRAPVFYDSNNTGYYLDPASGSYLSSATFDNLITGRNSPSTDVNTANDTGSISIRGSTTTVAAMSFHRAGAYAINMGVGTDNIFRIGGWSALSNCFQMDSSGNITALTSSRAPIFYDSNNTGYFLDPAGSSNLLSVQINGTLDVRDSNAQFWRSTNGAYQRVDTRTDATSLSRAHWYGVSSSGGTSNFRHAWYDNAAYFYVTAQDGEIIFNREAGETIVRSTGSFRAPIFYDTNDTSYYLDPNSTSVLNAVHTWGEISSKRADGGSLLRSYNTSAGQPLQFYLDHNLGNVNIGNSRGVVFAGGSYWEIANSVRAPIFYDSNNTAFYIDPNSASRLERLVLSARYDNYFVGSMTTVNAVNNFQTLTDTFGQMNVMQVSDTSGFTNGPTGLYPYGAVTSWRTENHSYQMYASHTGDLAYKTQWNNDNYTGWQTPVIYGRIGNSASGRAIYGSVYYDTDNTGYYVDPAGMSQLTYGRFNGDWASSGVHPEQLTVRGTYPSLTLRATNSNQAYWLFHNNGTNLEFYGGRGNPDGGSWDWGFRIYGVLDGTYGEGNSSLRAPIFYDSNNTAYYLDASSTGTSLNVAGSIVAAGNVTAYSDIRIKANVETIPSALDKLDLIRGVTYTRTDLDDKEQRYAGVIAQEIEAVLPEAVRDLGNIKAVDYNATIALLIQAVKELRDEVEALRK